MFNTQLPNGTELAGEVIAEDYDGWGADVIDDFKRNEFNGHVGSALLLQNDRLRVWSISLQPGQRWNVHRHVLDYFWTAVTDGRSRQHTSDGTTRIVEYKAGESRFFAFAEGEFLLHDIANVGDQKLEFVTVELIDSKNQALSL